MFNNTGAQVQGCVCWFLAFCLLVLVILKIWKLHYNQSQMEIHTVAAREVPRVLRLKSHPKDYQQKLTNTVTHPSTNRGRCCLTQVYQAVGRSSMPITINNMITAKQCLWTFFALQVRGCVVIPSFIII